MPWFCLKDVVIDGEVVVARGETLPDDDPLPRRYRNHFRADGRAFMDERNARRRKRPYGDIGPRITTQIETEDS